MLAGWAVALALALPGIARLELRTDGHALVPPGAPAVRVDEEVRRIFGRRDPLLVLIEPAHADGVYNPETLRRLVRLSEALAALPGIGREHVHSLATQRGDRYSLDTRDFSPVLDPFPSDSEELARVRKEVAWLDIPVGLLVSADGSAATVVVGVPPSSAAESSDRYELWRQVDEQARRFADPSHRITVVGAPAAEALLGRHVLEDLTFLVPAALVLVAVILFLGLRRLAAVALGLGKVGICLAVLFGAMGWLGEPVFLTTAVLPVILVAVGLADEIHLLARYQELLRNGVSPAEARERTFSELGHAVALALVTTMIGFGSFALAPIPALAHFGVVAAAGVGLCLLFSLTATPAVLSRMPAEWLRPRRRPAAARGNRALERWADLVTRRPLAVLAVLGIATLLIGAGIFRLEVQDSWLEGFSPRSELRQATDRLDERFLGSHQLLLEVRFGADAPPRPLLDPQVLARLGELEAMLLENPGVGGVIGPYRLLTTTAGIAGGDVRFRRIEERPEWNADLYGYVDRILGTEARREIVTDDFSRGIVQVFLRHANYRDTAKLIGRVRSFERERIAPLGGKVSFAGDVAVSQEMIPAIVNGQVRSLAGALLGSALTVAFGLRKPSAGLAAIVPALGAVLWTFGVMGWAGIPLGVATSMFCAITLGIGDDYAIHFLERRELAIAEGEPEPVRTAIVETGPAILWDALAIAVGFGLLAFSQVPPNRRLGLLVGLALLTAAAFTLTGLSSVLSIRKRR